MTMSPDPTSSAPYTTQVLDSNPQIGNPRNILRLRCITGVYGHGVQARPRGESRKSGCSIWIAERLQQTWVKPKCFRKNVYPQYDLWYEAALKRAVRLDSRKLYFFELRAGSGAAPEDGYVVFGPQPLGGQDYPSAFGLSFRTVSRKLAGLNLESISQGSMR